MERKNNFKAPRFGVKLIEFYLGSRGEDLLGDLVELYKRDASRFNKFSARVKFNLRALFLLMSYTARVRKKEKISFQTSNNIFPMLKNYFSISYRNLVRHKLFTFINIIGLAISMSVGLLLLGMIWDLLKFDEFHDKKDRIYRVITVRDSNRHGIENYATTSLPLANWVRENISGVEYSVPAFRNLHAEAETEIKQLTLAGHFTNNEFLSAFSFKWLEGNRSTALSNPYSIVLTRKTALKFFNKEDPVGEVIKFKRFGEYTVTGIIEDPPKFSHLQFEALASINTLPLLETQGKIHPITDNWGNIYSTYLYLVLNKNTDPDMITESLENISEEVNRSLDNQKVSFKLLKLRDIIPGDNMSNMGRGPKMPKLPLILLSAIAFAILLSACFNYTNLSIARALKRAREIGVRKVLGSHKKQIVFQFITETIIVSLIALVLSILIFIWVKPYFLSSLPRASMMLDLNLELPVILIFIAFAVLTGLLAGVFPAFYFAGMSPIKALRDPDRLKRKGKMGARKILLVIQFSLSLLFILAFIISSKQYRYSLNFDMGFEKENILNIPLKETDPELFANEMLKVPGVVSVGMISHILGSGEKWGLWAKHVESEDSAVAYRMSGDEVFIKNIGLNFLAGRNINNQIDPKGKAIVVNEKFASRFGFESYPDIFDQTFEVGENIAKVVGVVEDFNFSHTEDPIEPFFIYDLPEIYNYGSVKIATPDVITTLTNIENKWKKISPKKEFTATFFSDQIQGFYYYLKNVLRIFGFLGFIAISLACMGLLGMAVYSIENRTKEIGIRKTFGASVWSITKLMTRGFVLILFFAGCITAPLTYLLFDRVILAENFYRVQITLFDILGGFMLLLTIGLITISSQTMKAARSNPAYTLRDE